MPTTKKFPKTMTPVRVDEELKQRVEKAVVRYHGKQNTGQGYVIRDALQYVENLGGLTPEMLAKGQLMGEANRNIQATLTEQQFNFVEGAKAKFGVTQAYIVRACVSIFLDSLDEKEREYVVE